MFLNGMLFFHKLRKAYSLCFKFSEDAENCHVRADKAGTHTDSQISENADYDIGTLVNSVREFACFQDLK